MFADIPVTVIEGSAPGKTLLVTAGVDGDEYAGIEAAYMLAEKYRGMRFTGTLIILPIVNLSGFKAECSRNPDDEKFPKNIFPGSEHGSESEQLIHWLRTTYVDRADAWIDFHGGAMTEELRPFVWTFETGNRAVDIFIEMFQQQCGDYPIVSDRSHRATKARILAEKGKVYIMTESGQGGERNEAAAHLHIRWCEELMRLMGILEKTTSDTIPKRRPVFHTIEFIEAPFEGLFHPEHLQANVEKGEKLGSYSDYLGLQWHNVYAPCAGTLLWHKRTISMRPSDTLWAIGH